MSYPTILGVNIDHIATVRQARGTLYPDLIEAVREVEKTAAQAITIHLREDRRHIQDADVPAIQNMTSRRLNFELAATDEMVEIACKVKPHDCCIVPESREELTTEGGLDVIGQYDRIAKATQVLTQAGIRVSLFIEPDEKHIQRAFDMGAPVIELHTGAYAMQPDNSTKSNEFFEQLVAATEFADKLGIHVNAGHGLHYTNTKRVADIPAIQELNIGHAIIARALFVGLRQATQEMLDVIAA
jgi:pyridoxine 5-phosphate synthase